MLSPFRGNFHAFSVIRLSFPCHNSFDLPKLPTDFIHHFLGSPPYRIHGQTTEHESHHRTDENSGQHLRIHQGNIIVIHKISQCGISRPHHIISNFQHFLAHPQQTNLDFFNIRGYQSQSGQCCRTNSESFTRGSSSITQSVKRIRTVTNFLSQLTHFSVTPGIIGNRSVSIRGQSYT